MLNSYDLPFFKISSGDITNKLLLEHVAFKNKPVVLSSGMSTLTDVENAINILVDNGLKKDVITVLHCNTEYPTPLEDVNLYAMNTMKKKLNINVGYSDHTLGIDVPIAAVSLGASIIEKHFTLDKNMIGPDHAASLNPSQLKEMVKSIRNIEKAVSGSGLKIPSKSEIKNIKVARKSIHINKNLQKNHIITIDDLIMKRPGDGISPMDYNKVIGRKININLELDSKMCWSYLYD